MIPHMPSFVKTRKLILACLLGTAVLLAALVLAVCFWPITTAPPEAVVAACLEALQTGNVEAAQRWWVVRLPGHEDAALIARREAERRAKIEELAALMPEAVVHVSPATYWTHCCEPAQLPDGYDAFAARLEVTLQREGDTRRITFYLSDAAHDGLAWAWGLPWTRWWQRPRGRQHWRITSVGLP